MTSISIVVNIAGVVPRIERWRVEVLSYYDLERHANLRQREVEGAARQAALLREATPRGARKSWSKGLERPRARVELVMASLGSWVLPRPCCDRYAEGCRGY